MAARHDTSAAYKHDHCRCPQAVTEEKRRKTRAAALVSHVEGGIPPFHADPRRGCAELLDPDVMFPDKPEQVPVAKRVCAPCPFRRSCADWALQTGQLYGVWGGVTAGERRRQIAKRLEAVMS
ncbi:MAG: WhiB family transcriptional regulator [Actinoplanes sp.]